MSVLNVRTIQRLESGEDASLETLRCIAEALNVEVMELFESVGSEEKLKQIEAFSLEQKKRIRKYYGGMINMLDLLCLSFGELLFLCFIF